MRWVSSLFMALIALLIMLILLFAALNLLKGLHIPLISPLAGGAENLAQGGTP